MSFESLSHSPEFELPDTAPHPPADLVSLIEECYMGLKRATIKKKIARNKYDLVASVMIQENPTKKSTPSAPAEDIAEYFLLCMQWEVNKSDDPGCYKVTLFGPGGRGSFERSKHIDLSDGDGEARSKTMLSESEILEAQQSYIGELHEQNIALMEMVNTVSMGLMKENKDMMKIVSEAQKIRGEVEVNRMKHELELKMHADEVKAKELEEEHKRERWDKFYEMVKESEAIDLIVKAAAKKMNEAKNEAKKKAQDSKKKTSEESSDKKSKPADEPESSRAERAKKRSKKKSGKKRPKPEEPSAGSESSTESVTTSETETEPQSEAMDVDEGFKKAMESELLLKVEMLKMTIDQNEQWEIVKKTLSEKQFTLFQEILESKNEDDIRIKTKRLYALKGKSRFMELESVLEEDQKDLIEPLIEIALT